MNDSNTSIETFVASFQEDTDEIKPFVRDSKAMSSSEHNNKPAIYRPEKKSSRVSEMDKIILEMKVLENLLHFSYLSQL